MSCYLREASIQLTANAMDATPFCAAVKEYIEDFPDARATISGFYDTSTAGPVRVLLPRFGRGRFLRGVICPEGYGIDKQVQAFQGILTNFSTTRSVSDIQNLSLDTQISGGVYVAQALNEFLADQLDGATTSYVVDRTTALSAPYDAATYDGLLYFTVYNGSGGSLTFNVRHGAGAAAAAAATPVITTTLADGEVYAGVAGTSANPITVESHVRVDVGSAPGGTVDFLVALVDLELGLVPGS